MLAFPDIETQQDRQLEYGKETCVSVLSQLADNLLAEERRTSITQKYSSDKFVKECLPHMISTVTVLDKTGKQLYLAR